MSEGFVLHWQDYRGWRSASATQPHPKVIKERFSTRDEAEQRKTLLKLQNPEVVACVREATAPRTRVTKRTMSEALTAAGIPEIPGGMRLTR